MKKSGCSSLLFGIESANPQILKNIKKGTTPDQARFALRLSNQLGFKTIASFILGSPGETKETIRETIDFACQLNPTIASFNRLVPFPGTEVFEVYYKDKYNDGSRWDDFVPKAAVPLVDIEGLTVKDIQYFTNSAYRKFYLRLSQILRILSSIKTLGEFQAYTRGAYGLFRQMLRWQKSKTIKYN